jgi:hypothetical protein
MDFKKTLLIICLFVGLNTFAQNRLEFNQVLTIDTNYTGSFAGNVNHIHYGSDYYVPAGTVWKIESHATDGTLEINDIEVPFVIYGGSGSSQSVAVNNIFPIWLKSGDKIRYRWNGYCSSNGGCAITYQFFISIIEFNIVTD